MKNVFYLGLILILFSCKSEIKSSNANSAIEQDNIENYEGEVVESTYKEILPTYIFPKVKNVEDSKSTVFSATLESDLSKNKNVVYAASLLMAWDEIETRIGGKLYDFGSSELEKMYNSTSHQNVLKSNEYKASVEIRGTEIHAKAEFNKALPFRHPLTKNSKKLSFGKNKVSSFGFRGNEHMVQIIYYNNDNDFCIVITPRDKYHQIYLLKSDKYESTFKENFDSVLAKRKKQRETEINRWKLHLERKDIAKVPIIEFNLENCFEDIEKTLFYKDKLDLFKVLKAWQRTGFILNEKGAIIESQGSMAAEGAVAAVAEEKNHPLQRN